jgi:hypothetical protein
MFLSDTKDVKQHGTKTRAGISSAHAMLKTGQQQDAWSRRNQTRHQTTVKTKRLRKTKMTTRCEPPVTTENEPVRRTVAGLPKPVVAAETEEPPPPADHDNTQKQMQE